MSSERDVFWTKFNEMSKEHKEYVGGNDTYEILATLIILKFNIDAEIAFSRTPSWFVKDNQKYVNRLLMKFPGIYQAFNKDDYYSILKDKDKRKAYMYKLLSKL